MRYVCYTVTTRQRSGHNYRAIARCTLAGL